MVAGSGAQTTPILRGPQLGAFYGKCPGVNVALGLVLDFQRGLCIPQATAYDHRQYSGILYSTRYEYFDVADTSALSGEYFKRTGAVDSNRHCNTAGAGTGYSGNLLNYAATSSIDLLRYALTGGNRVLDTASKTVLGRAFLPSNFGGIRSEYFPQKELANAWSARSRLNSDARRSHQTTAARLYFNSCDALMSCGQ